MTITWILTALTCTGVFIYGLYLTKRKGEKR